MNARVQSPELKLVVKELPSCERGWFPLQGDSFPDRIFISSSKLGSAGKSGASGAKTRKKLITSVPGAPERSTEQSTERSAERSAPAAVLSVTQVHGLDIARVRQGSDGSCEVELLPAMWSGDELVIKPARHIAMFSAQDDEKLVEMLGELDADGIITNCDKFGLGVTVADCLPLFIRSGCWRCVLHSGWKGTGIFEHLLRRLEENAEPNAAVNTVLGPCISTKNYEVPVERAKMFANKFGATAVSGRNLDLRAANIVFANRHDCRSCTVWTSCTVDNSGLFSYRQSGPREYSLMFAYYPPLGETRDTHRNDDERV